MRILSFIGMMVFSTLAFTAPCDGAVTLYGQIVQVDLEGGCWAFVDDWGMVYEIVGLPKPYQQDGLVGYLTGCDYDGFTTCMVGYPLLYSQFQEENPCDDPEIVVHGTVFQGDYFGDCYGFEGDDGTIYELVNASPSILKDGLSGTLYANPFNGMTACMMGYPVEVCSFDTDNTVTLVGTVRQETFEGGCWVLEVGNKTYEPWSTDPAFYQDGMRVKVKGLIKDDAYSICMVGPVVEVVSWEEMSSHDYQCWLDYLQCKDTCSKNVCFVSCETLYDNCLANQ